VFTDDGAGRVAGLKPGRGVKPFDLTAQDRPQGLIHDQKERKFEARGAGVEYQDGIVGHRVLPYRVLGRLGTTPMRHQLEYRRRRQARAYAVGAAG
jgi:hypothetical protein